MRTLLFALAAIFTLSSCETPTAVNVATERPVSRVYVVPQTYDPYPYPVYRTRVIVRRHRHYGHDHDD